MVVCPFVTRDWLATSSGCTSPPTQSPGIGTSTPWAEWGYLTPLKQRHLEGQKSGSLQMLQPTIPPRPFNHIGNSTFCASKNRNKMISANYFLVRLRVLHMLPNVGRLRSNVPRFVLSTNGPQQKREEHHNIKILTRLYESLKFGAFPWTFGSPKM